MKKFFASLLGLTLPIFSWANVHIYVRMDVGIETLSGLNYPGKSSRTKIQSGDWGTSWLGFMGSEDLGGGNRAVFRFEAPMQPVRGTIRNDNTLFDRWAYVGFSNEQVGTLTFGRMLFIDNGVWDYDPFGQSNWSSASMVRGRNWNHNNNNIHYQSPSIKGFDVAVDYSLGKSTAQTPNTYPYFGKSWGAQLSFVAPSFSARIIVDEIQNGKTGQYDDLFTYSREYFAGLKFNPTQALMIQIAYTHMYAPNASTASPNRGNHTWAGLTWMATLLSKITLGVFHIDTNQSAVHATMYEIGTTYNLSKHTFLYANLATVQNSKDANFSLNANRAGMNNPENPILGGSQSGLYAGLVTSF